jgi:hypothetical protein
MKQVKWVVAVAFMVLSGMAVAQKIGSLRIVTDVPFEFMVANKVVPAGQYVVQAATMDGHSLFIRNAGAKVGLVSPTNTSEAKLRSSHYALVFMRYGDRYFLSGIKLEGSNISYRLPESKAERELRAKNAPSTEETLVASSQ